MQCYLLMTWSSIILKDMNVPLLPLKPIEVLVGCKGGGGGNGGGGGGSGVVTTMVGDCSARWQPYRDTPTNTSASLKSSSLLQVRPK